jgi:hypothetical protein
VLTSIFAVKRRFIRQNREIAKVNSTQSLRIRNLEAEISRLLAENITLREQAINSAQEAERWRTSQRLAKEVESLKEKLDAKLLEVGTLVTELGSLPEKAARRSSHRRRSGIVTVVKSPDQRDWKNQQTIGSVLAGERELQDGRLPAILEDKYYPCRTMESQDLQRLVDGPAEASESPDLGPPPVAHFDVPDPIKFDPQPREEAAARAGSAENAVSESNLEIRRKRRTSSLLENMSTLHLTNSDHASEAERTNGTLKSGAKRKLSVRDGDEDDVSNRSTTDEFAFQRKSVTASTPLPRAKGSRFTRPPNRQPLTSLDRSMSDAPQKVDCFPRNVLAPKNTNSPAKARPTSLDDKIAALKEDVARQAQARSERQGIRGKAKHVPAPISTTDDLKRDKPPSGHPDIHDIPPETPAGLNLFSPASTEPSAKTNAQPSEAAISTAVEDVLNSAGRGSRRAKAAVSYAEPNLRDKMRRPGKELVAAVEGIDRFRDREASVRAVSAEPKIKAEPDTSDGDWTRLQHGKDDPTSPLREKADRLSNESRDATEPSEKIASVEQLEQGIPKLSIYDGPVSSPRSDSVSSDTPEPETAGAKRPALKSRRHSNNPAGLARMGQDLAGSSTTRPPRPSSATGQRPELDRPSSAAGLKRPASTTGDRHRVEAEGVLKRSTSAAALGDANARAERVSARRRSMMV